MTQKKLTSDSKENDFQSVITEIRKVLTQYSTKDIAFSLLISNLWLPNIASPVKHQLLYAIFLNTIPNRFSKKDKVTSYNEFCGFLERVFSLLPEFPWIEDYVPESDWGNVKFHHDGSDHRIFYGNEIGNIYDYLMLFQVLYSSRNKDYLKLTSRSPLKELKSCLELQDAIISGITKQPAGEELDVSPGDLEKPPEDYWKQSLKFWGKFNPLEVITGQFAEHFSCKLGSLPKNSLTLEKFGSLIFKGRLFSSYFIKIDNRLIPFLPRRYSSILLEEWASLFSKYEEKLNKKNSYSKHVAAEIYDFLKKRIRSKSLFPFVSAVTKDEKPHKVVFSSSFISKDRLILVYTPAPFSSGEELGEKLSKLAPKLKEALMLIGSSPVTLGLRAHGQILKYASDSNGETLKPELLIVLSQTSTEMQKIPLSKDLPGRTVFLDQFLGVFDEIEEVDEATDFFEYLEEIEPKLLRLPFGLLDKYGSFKDSAGVLVGGARNPDMIMIYPHWGSNRRYETLSKFWDKYPDSGFFDHPRSWKIKQASAKGIRLIARGYFGSALYCQVGSSRFFTNAPFHVMSYQQGQIANLLMESLEDSISRNESVLEKHTFFQTYEQSQVSFFPWSLVRKNDKFKHLRHLDPDGSLWKADIGFVKAGVPGIRVVFNKKLITDALEGVKDSTLEIDLLIEVLNKLNRFAPDSDFSSILSKLSEQKSNKPRFTLFRVQKEVSFPEFILAHKPSIHHLKKARKVVAELAEKADLSPGSYKLNDAQEKLNILRKKIVSLIDNEVSKHKYEDTIPYLIERIDALNHKYEYEGSSIKRSLRHDVDYDREERYTEVHNEYVKQHKNFRYLIEKFVQIKPAGRMHLDKNRFQFLIALIDKLHEIYAASDSVQYDIYPVGISLDDDYVVQVNYKANLKAMQESYGQEQAKINLGLVGSEADRVESPKPIEDFLNELDTAFKQDLKFSLRSMVNILQILSQWSGYQTKVQENSYYSATRDEISEVCLKNIRGIQESEIEPILNFLTLKTHDVVRVLGQDEPCEDLPVWEYRKRYSRYNLRPLILIGEKYFWGPHSARRSGVIWAQAPVTGSLPIDLQGSAIQQTIEKEKNSIEEALDSKTLEIIKRLTEHAEQDVRLHARDKRGGHPEELGDYDVLAFYPEKNVVLNIEDKDILPAFCLKDSKRLRDYIFGSKKDERYLEKVEKRGTYLANNLVKIARLLGWSIDTDKLPKVISLFISRQSYWWTRFPPRSTKVKFLRIDLLSKFLEDL